MWRWIPLVLLLILSGCAGGPMATPSDSRPPWPTTSAGPAAPSGAPAALTPQRWQAILDDLAARDVVGEPNLTSAEQVTFSSGALGCPAPGKSYTQALVEGMKVILTVAGITYDYRFGDGDQPLLCER